ncbi:hypothetical protein [Bacteroides sp.]|uniref:hypothetical protein n=1 Tax=Bacteroides sp. TaxID=29523 RepID=UPI0025BEFC1D|nr:hypothetical protein [Bacteroides sp.]
MIQIIQLKGKDKHLYRLLAPMVMDPEVIRANNNYPFKTSEEYVWFIAIKDKEVMGFVPVEQKSRKKAVINNYYVKLEGTEREEILSQLLPAIIAEFDSGSWLLNSVTLIQDKETFEKFEFISMDKKWTRYVKMYK